MKPNYSKTISALFLVFSFATSGWAQSSTSAIFLLQSQGARGVALGESFVAVADGIHSLYWNPAGLVSSRKELELSFTHRPELFRDFLNYEYGNLAYQISNRSAVAVNFSYVDFGRQIGEFESFHDFSYAFSVSFATSFIKNLSTGITIKRISQRLGPVSDDSYAADFGALYRIRNVLNTRSSKGQLNLGASVSNIGEKVKFIEGQSDPLPKFLRLGFAYDTASQGTWANTGLPNLGMLVAFEYQNLLNDWEDIWEWGAGVELRFLGLMSFRLGYHERHPKPNRTLIRKTLETGTTVGVGVNLPIYLFFKMSRPLTFQFDFASAPQNGFVDDYQMYTFGVNWEI